MGWLDYLRSPTPDRFAQMVCDLLRQSGVTDPIRYNRETFTLHYGSPETQLGLHNAFAEYARAPRSQRRPLLQRYIATILTTPSALPEDFSEARAVLLPRVRSRLFYERMHLRFPPDAHIPFTPLGDHLGVDVVIDTPQASSPVSRSRLTGWGVTFDEALAVAKDNLWEISKQNFQQVSPGLYAPGREDTYDAARLFLHDLIWQLPVKGRHVAVVPHRNLLLVCGSEDPGALAAMAKLATAGLQDSRAETGIPVILNGPRWETARPTHEYLAPLRELYVHSVASEYGEQASWLEQQQTDDSPYVASVMLTQNRQTGEFCTVSVWGEGVKTLLPRAEVIAFMRGSADGPRPDSIMARWDDVQQICGPLMQPQDRYPPRWLVEQFPSNDQLQALSAPPS